MAWVGRCGMPARRAPTLVSREAVVVETFAREVVVDGAMGGLGGGPQRPRELGKDRVWEGPEVFRPVVPGQFVFGGLVETDAEVSVELAGWGLRRRRCGYGVTATAASKPTQPGQLSGGFEVLIDDQVTFGPSSKADGVDGQHDLLVALWSPACG